MFALLTLSAALASEQRLVYDLSVNGAVVGSREVTIRYLDRPNGQRRIVESVTQVKFAGQDLLCRAVGQSSSRVATFSSQAQRNGVLGQYQGVMMPGSGWELTLAGGGQVQTVTYTARDNVLTTLDLVDPGRTGRLAEGGRATVFFVETADVLAGTLSGGAPATITQGGASVPATTYALAVDGGGDATFAVNEDGLLLRSEVSWLGVRVLVALRELPQPRGFGTVELDEFGSGVKEEGL